MPNTVPTATFEDVARDMVTAHADAMAAQYRADQRVELEWTGQSDRYTNLENMATALEVVASGLRG
jgi:hypothetical protein